MTRKTLSPTAILATILATLLTTALLAGPAVAQEYTIADPSHCTWSTTGGVDGFLPLLPGLSITLLGEEEDEGETIEIESINTVLTDTERVDGVLTRVYEERESEDGELVEVSRNFFAICRETGDVWYFGEDVDDYDDGVIVGHGGAWRAGQDGAQAGIVMPGSPFLGARYFEEVAPGVAQDQGEIVSLGEEVETPAGTFTDTVGTVGTNPLDPGSGDEKYYARGIGNIVDEDLELAELTLPACMPDATTHCLNDGRFRVEVEWKDFANNEGEGQAILPTDLSGEFWFFEAENTELLVKVIDGCNSEFESFWVFAAGLTNVEVELTVTDTVTQDTWTRENSLGSTFEPVLDTSAFFTCDA